MKKEYMNVDANKLHMELIDRGIIPLTVKSTGDRTIIVFEHDTDMELAEQIVSAHDPTPMPPQLTEKEILRDYILDIDYRLILMELGL